jgi:OmpA-OmpF porin, OOP family
MRKNLTRVLSTLVTVGLLGLGASGCSVSVNAGKKEPPPPPPPAPAPAPAPEPPPPAPKKSLPKMNFKVNEKGEVQLPGPVLFQTGTAKLLPESDAVLNVVLEYMKAKPEVTKLRVEGHTDTDGDNKANMDLSKARSVAVSAWLVAKGVECKRIIPVGFGEEKLLVNPEATSDDKARNRRVVFVNAEVNGKPVGGKPIDGGAPGEIAADPCK